MHSAASYGRARSAAALRCRELLLGLEPRRRAGGGIGTLACSRRCRDRSRRPGRGRGGSTSTRPPLPRGGLAGSAWSSSPGDLGGRAGAPPRPGRLQRGGLAATRGDPGRPAGRSDGLAEPPQATDELLEYAREHADTDDLDGFVLRCRGAGGTARTVGRRAPARGEVLVAVDNGVAVLPGGSAVRAAALGEGGQGTRALRAEGNVAAAARLRELQAPRIAAASPNRRRRQPWTPKNLRPSEASS
jgi:hypothetical protein